MFRSTQRTLRELPGAVDQDPVALRPRYTDVRDLSQPLQRWDLFSRSLGMDVAGQCGGTRVLLRGRDPFDHE
jgi:hypothetical protein